MLQSEKINKISLTDREKEFTVHNISVKPETYDRYITIINMITGDTVAEHLLELLIIKATDYIKTVCCNEVAIQTQKSRLDGEDLRSFMSQLDENRTRCHDALISSLHAFNRYIVKEFSDCPVGGIFSLDPIAIHNRVAVGDWAGQLVYTLFVTRSK